jgi:DNA-binding XRE family transcriptional regulator
MKPNELKAWRKKHKVSQAKLAKALGVNTLTISRWERRVYDIPPYLSLALKGLEAERRFEHGKHLPER